MSLEIQKLNTNWNKKGWSGEDIWMPSSEKEIKGLRDLVSPDWLWPLHWFLDFYSSRLVFFPAIDVTVSWIYFLLCLLGSCGCHHLSFPSQDLWGFRLADGTAEAAAAPRKTMETPRRWPRLCIRYDHHEFDERWWSKRSYIYSLLYHIRIRWTGSTRGCSRWSGRSCKVWSCRRSVRGLKVWRWGMEEKLAQMSIK
jgi:hypothetical protein